MKWIKASERLPDSSGTYFCKVKYFYTSEGQFSNVSVQFDCPFWRLHDENYVVAWLDESIPQPAPIPVKEEDDYWKQRCEAAEKVIYTNDIDLESDEYNKWQQLKQSKPQ